MSVDGTYEPGTGQLDCPMRFHVLGIGPVGSLLSSHLRRSLPSTHSISLIHKKARYVYAKDTSSLIRVEHDGVVSSSSNFLCEVFDPSELQNLPAHMAAAVAENEEAQNRIIESLFITTKAQATFGAIQKLLPRLNSDTTIVLLQNGMGVYEELVGKIFRNPRQRPHFILASNTHGVYSKARNHIVHTAVGQIQFAIAPDPSGRYYERGLVNEPPSPDLGDITQSDDPEFHKYRSLRNTVAALLLAEGLNASWQPMAQVQVLMRRKLVVNAVINPLTAVLNCRNGEILSQDRGRYFLRNICREAANVFAVEYTQMSATVPPALTAPSLEAECLRVADLTKNNTSSMLADIRAAKDTEIDYINGHLLGLGKRYRVKMPVTASLLNLIKLRSAIPIDQTP